MQLLAIQADLLSKNFHKLCLTEVLWSAQNKSKFDCFGKVKG